MSNGEEGGINQVIMINPKFEILNPKQIPKSKFQCSKHCLGFGVLEFRYYLEFSAWDLGFY